jgi:hypothetical protein
MASSGGQPWSGTLPVTSYGGVVMGGERKYGIVNQAFNPVAYVPTLNASPSVVPTVASASNNPLTGDSGPTPTISTRTFAISAVVILVIGMLGLHYIHFR